MKNEKLEAIKEILVDAYDGKMADSDVNVFAKQLHYSLFVGKHDLGDIISTVFENESEAGIEDSEWHYVFCQTIDLLDNCEETAQRLYDCFMNEWDILEIFLKLYFENDEYISEEQMSEAQEKALSLFGKDTLRSVGVIG